MMAQTCSMHVWAFCCKTYRSAWPLKIIDQAVYYTACFFDWNYKKIMSLQQIVGIKGYIQTTYLAVYPDKLLLLDAGCRADVDTILSYITDTLQRPIHQLKTVVVTHMHPDHAGGAAILRQKTGCQIVTSAKAAMWYKGLSGRKQHLKDLALTYYVASRRAKPLINQWYNPVVSADVIAEEGDRVVGFEDWVILQTPGHTSCDISLWHPDTKQAYTGDLVLKINNKLVSPLVIHFPDLYKASLSKVQNLALDTLILAHDGKVAIGAADFDQLIAKVPDQPRDMKLLDVLGIKWPKGVGKVVKRLGASL